jgi:hypothetical protein
MPKRKENLNDKDKRVLVEMLDERFTVIATMARYTGLEPAQVRRSYRKMKRMGLAYFTTGYDEDEYYVSGSGYVLTSAGEEVRNALRLEVNE